MNRNKYLIYFGNKKRYRIWLEKCETETVECAIMRKIAQKEAVNDVRAQADRWRYQQWL